MSQINCLPRPAFWKVPDYINKMYNENAYKQEQIPFPTPRKSSLTVYRNPKPHNQNVKKRVRFKDIDDDHQYHHHYVDDANHVSIQQYIKFYFACII